MIEPDVMMSAALEQLKEFIRDIAPADKLAAHAMRLAGEPLGVIDHETRELFEALRRQFPPLWHVRLSDSPSRCVSLFANESGRSRATHDDDEVQQPWRLRGLNGHTGRAAFAQRHLQFVKSRPPS
jgi:hypothetical protein